MLAMAPLTEEDELVLRSIIVPEELPQGSAAQLAHVGGGGSTQQPRTIQTRRKEESSPGEDPLLFGVTCPVSASYAYGVLKRARKQQQQAATATTSSSSPAAPEMAFLETTSHSLPVVWFGYTFEDGDIENEFRIFFYAHQNATLVAMLLGSIVFSVALATLTHTSGWLFTILTVNACVAFTAVSMHVLSLLQNSSVRNNSKVCGSASPAPALPLFTRSRRPEIAVTPSAEETIEASDDTNRRGPSWHFVWKDSPTTLREVRLYEMLCVTLCLTMVCLNVFWYRLAVRCIQLNLTTFFPDRIDVCIDLPWPTPYGVTIVVALVVTLRARWTVPLAVLSLPAAALPKLEFLGKYDTVDVVRVNIIVLSVFIATTVVVKLRNERLARERFCSLAYAHAERKLATQSLQQLDKALAMIVHPGVLRHHEARREGLHDGTHDAVDVAELAAVGIIDVVDFAKWSTLQPPHMMCIELDRMINLLDELLDCSPGVEKLLGTGDQYVVVSGLVHGYSSTPIDAALTPENGTPANNGACSSAAVFLLGARRVFRHFVGVLPDDDVTWKHLTLRFVVAAGPLAGGPLSDELPLAYGVHGYAMDAARVMVERAEPWRVMADATAARLVGPTVYVSSEVVCMVPWNANGLEVSGATFLEPQTPHTLQAPSLLSLRECHEISLTNFGDSGASAQRAAGPPVSNFSMVSYSGTDAHELMTPMGGETSRGLLSPLSPPDDDSSETTLHHQQHMAMMDPRTVMEVNRKRAYSTVLNHLSILALPLSGRGGDGGKQRNPAAASLPTSTAPHNSGGRLTGGGLVPFSRSMAARYRAVNDLWRRAERHDGRSGDAVGGAAGGSGASVHQGAAVESGGNPFVVQRNGEETTGASVAHLQPRRCTLPRSALLVLRSILRKLSSEADATGSGHDGVDDDDDVRPMNRADYFVLMDIVEVSSISASDVNRSSNNNNDTDKHDHGILCRSMMRDAFINDVFRTSTRLAATTNRVAVLAAFAFWVVVYVVHCFDVVKGAKTLRSPKASPVASNVSTSSTDVFAPLVSPDEITQSASLRLAVIAGALLLMWWFASKKRLVFRLALWMLRRSGDDDDTTTIVSNQRRSSSGSLSDGERAHGSIVILSQATAVEYFAMMAVLLVAMVVEYASLTFSPVGVMNMNFQFLYFSHLGVVVSLGTEPLYAVLWTLGSAAAETIMSIILFDTVSSITMSNTYFFLIAVSAFLIGVETRHQVHRERLRFIVGVVTAASLQLRSDELRLHGFVQDELVPAPLRDDYMRRFRAAMSRGIKSLGGNQRQLFDWNDVVVVDLQAHFVVPLHTTIGGRQEHCASAPVRVEGEGNPFSDARSSCSSSSPRSHRRRTPVETILQFLRESDPNPMPKSRHSESAAGRGSTASSNLARCSVQGDRLLLAGPLLGDEEVETDDKVFKVLYATVRLLQRMEEWNRQQRGRAKSDLDDMSFLLTCVAHFGPAAGAFVGRRVVSFRLLGHIVSAAASLRCAAPAGFIGITEALLRAVSNHAEDFKLRSATAAVCKAPQNDVVADVQRHVLRQFVSTRLGRQQTWSLRGAGMIRVSPVVPSTVMTTTQ